MGAPIGHAPTIKDVARIARVSVGTVSRVLNDDAAVRPPMRDAVRRAIKQLHYTPNLAARGLRSSHTQTIGMLVPDLRLPNAADGIRGCEEAAESRGFSVLIADARGDRQRQQNQARVLVAKRVDGLLYAAPLGDPTDLIDDVQAAGIPTVVAGVPEGVRTGTPPAAIAAIDPDHATEAALRRVIEAGHRHAGLVSVDNAFFQVRLNEILRIAARTAPDRLSIRPLVAPEPELAGLVAANLRSADRTAATTVLLVLGTHSLPAALTGVREAGLRVGPALSMVVIEDSKWAAALTPPLDAVAFDWYAHLAEATELLLEVLGGRPTGRVLVRRSEYIQRRSIFPAPRVEAGA